MLTGLRDRRMNGWEKETNGDQWVDGRMDGWCGRLNRQRLDPPGTFFPQM